MDVKTINRLLAQGEIDHQEMWPRKTELESKTIQFRFDFGLDRLPEEPGLILIRGPRQYGKSTWLELNLHESTRHYGGGSTFYLNGDEVGTAEELATQLADLAPLYSREAKTKRLFIDEITAVPSWEKGVKRVLDMGLLRDVLIVTTGSKALDLRRGSERLPGRKGKLGRTDYIFLPISYQEFHRHAATKFRDRTWTAYLLTGGSPIACHEIYRCGRLPEYFIQLMRDWIFGEIVASGRSRISLTHLIQVLFLNGGQPVGYAKLAREAGLANNTVASGYIEQLSDLLCVLPSWPWESSRGRLQLRRPCKFHFINLASVVALHPAGLRTVEEFESLPNETQGLCMEWLVAQEIWRRAVLNNLSNPETIGFWQSADHEIDFVTPDEELVEVKRGRAGPLDFTWFAKVFPKKELTVITSTPFETRQIRGITIEEFLHS